MPPVETTADPMPILKTTTSVCSTCLTKVPAQVVSDGDDVVLRKECPEHGIQETLIASDKRFHWTAGPAGSCGDGCGLLNHSCSLVFEITGELDHVAVVLPLGEKPVQLAREILHGHLPGQVG